MIIINIILMMMTIIIIGQWDPRDRSRLKKKENKGKKSNEQRNKTPRWQKLMDNSEH